MSAETQQLPNLPVGDRAFVASIGGDPAFRRRLLEQGLIPGAEVYMRRKAPFGGAISLDVHHTTLSLDRRQAHHVFVCTQKVPPQPSSCDNAISTTDKTATERVKPEPAGDAPRRPSDRPFRILIAGNPNTGKSTFFNSLSGARVRVSNYPGSTVEQRRARLSLGQSTVELCDLPGTYSLNANSAEERLAIDTLLDPRQPVDLVLVLLNATSLRRSLYLLLQIRELGLPVVAALNMSDEASRQGISIDTHLLGQALGCEVIPTVARSGQGLSELRSTLESTLIRLPSSPARELQRWLWRPPPMLSETLEAISSRFLSQPGSTHASALKKHPALALWHLLCPAPASSAGVLPEAELTTYRNALHAAGLDLDLAVTSGRYAAIDRVLKDCVNAQTAKTRSVSERIDHVLTHPLWGLLTFLTLMALIFTALFDWATPAMDAIDALFGIGATALAETLPPGLLASFLTDGLIRGVGSVVVFLPQIVLLFLFLTLLEDCGYMSRAVMMMDRVMKALGLPGKAFVPLMAGYACAIPAILATRTLQRRRDRLLTMMVIPLVSCSARLPVYTLIIGALFPAEERVLGFLSLGGLMMLSLYLLSMIFALVAAAVIGRTLLKGRRAALLIELPPYRLPTLRTLRLTLSRKAWLFLKTAGTVIVIASLVLWASLSLPRQISYSRDYSTLIHQAQRVGDTATARRLSKDRSAERLRGSYAGQLGRLIEPALKPLGFDWKIGIGLIGAFAAREVFVATLGIVYGVGEADGDSPNLRGAIRNARRPDGRPVYTPLTGLSLLVFFMLAMQCMSTLAVTRQESGSWKMTAFMLTYLTGLAYLATLAVYQVGSLFGANT